MIGFVECCVNFDGHFEWWQVVRLWGMVAGSGSGSTRGRGAHAVTAGMYGKLRPSVNTMGIALLGTTSITQVDNHWLRPLMAIWLYQYLIGHIARLLFIYAVV